MQVMIHERKYRHAYVSIKGRTKLILIAALSTYLTSCTIMRQPTYPAANQTSNNPLAAVVRIVPITASTMADIAQPEPNDSPSRVPAALLNWQYTIGPGDVLSIVVWDHPQLTIPAGPQRTPKEAGNWVSPDGTIFYPYIGTLQVAGKTINEVRTLVTDGLRSVIPRPQVDVTVASFASQKAQITGAVGSPGPVPITHIPLTLLDAIGLRDGTDAEADLQNITLVRNGRDYRISLKRFTRQGEIANNPQLQGGDVIVVPRYENNEVYVMGEVKSPGIVPLGDQSLSLTEALAASDGLNKMSVNASGIFVLRGLPDENQIDVYQLDVTDPTALLLGTRFTLAKGDVVYATSAPAARWNRVINNLIPSLGALNTLLLIQDRT